MHIHTGIVTIKREEIDSVLQRMVVKGVNDEFVQGLKEVAQRQISMSPNKPNLPISIALPVDVIKELEFEYALINVTHNELDALINKLEELKVSEKVLGEARDCKFLKLYQIAVRVPVSVLDKLNN